MAATAWRDSHIQSVFPCARFHGLSLIMPSPFAEDSPRTAFLPFPAERSDKLAKTFWETLGSPEALSALPEAPAPTSAPSPAVKESEKGQAVEEEIKEARENVSPEQVKQEADRALPGKATPSES